MTAAQAGSSSSTAAVPELDSAADAQSAAAITMTEAQAGSSSTAAVPVPDSCVDSDSVSAPQAKQAEGEQATQSPVPDVGRGSIVAEALVASPSPSVSGNMKKNDATAKPIAQSPPASPMADGSISSGSLSSGRPVSVVAVDVVLPSSVAGDSAISTVNAAAQAMPESPTVASEDNVGAQMASTGSAVVAETTAAVDLDQAASVSSTAVAQGDAAVAGSTSHPSISLAAPTASTAATAEAADQCLSSVVLPSATQDACSSDSIDISGQESQHTTERLSTSAETTAAAAHPSGQSQSCANSSQVTPDTAALTVSTQAVDNSQDSSMVLTQKIADASSPSSSGRSTAGDLSKAVVVYVPDVVHVKTPFGVITRQLDRADIEASRHKGMAAGRFNGRPEFAAICDDSAAANSSEQAFTSVLPSPQLLLGAIDQPQQQQQQTEVATPDAHSQAKVATSGAYSQDSACAASATDAQPPHQQSIVDQGDSCDSMADQTESTGSWRFRSWTDAAICAAASPVLVPMLAFGMGIHLYNSVSSACEVARLSADNCSIASNDYDSFTAGNSFS